MRADYDSEGNSIQIWLEEAENWDKDDVLAGDRVIVSSSSGRAVLVEIHAATRKLAESLAAVASAYDLDYEALLAAAEAALAAPDRTVTLSVAGRIAVA